MADGSHLIAGSGGPSYRAYVAEQAAGTRMAPSPNQPLAGDLGKRRPIHITLEEDTGPAVLVSTEPHPETGEIKTYSDGSRLWVYSEFDRGTERMETRYVVLAPVQATTSG